MLNTRDHSESLGSSYEVGEDGRIKTATVITANSDRDAVAQARQMADGRVLELWDRSRMILNLPTQE